jgi:cold shock CspA family protein
MKAAPKPGLAVAVTRPETNSHPVVVATYVLSDGVALREQLGEREYLELLGAFQEKLLERVDREATADKGRLYGDRVRFVYPVRSRLTAYIDAERVQVDWEEDEHRVGGVGVGIARGQAIEFAWPDGLPDFAGEVVERSFVLASRCAAGQVLVDEKAADYAELDSEVIDDSFAFAFGSVKHARVRGFKRPIAMREFQWDREQLDREAPSSASVAKAGKIATWDTEKGRGLIVTDVGDRYYTDRRHTAGVQRTERATRVFFSDEEPRVAGGNRLAAATIAIGDRLEGQVTKVNADYAVVEVHDKDGATLTLITATSEDHSTLAAGSIVEFSVGENVRGPTAEELSVVTGTSSLTLTRDMPSEARFVLALVEHLRGAGAAGAAGAVTKALGSDWFPERTTDAKDRQGLIALADYAIHSWARHGLRAIEEEELAADLDTWEPMKRTGDADLAEQLVASWRRTLRERKKPSPKRLPVTRDSVARLLTELQLALREIADLGDRASLDSSAPSRAAALAASHLGVALAIAFRGGIVTSLPPETKEALHAMRGS